MCNNNQPPRMSHADKEEASFPLTVVQVGNRTREDVAESCRGVFKRYAVLAGVGSCLLGVPRELEGHTVNLTQGASYAPPNEQV